MNWKTKYFKDVSFSQILQSNLSTIFAGLNSYMKIGTFIISQPNVQK